MFAILKSPEYVNRVNLNELLNKYYVRIPLHRYPESLSKKVSFSSHQFIEHINFDCFFIEIPQDSDDRFPRPLLWGPFSQ